MSIPNLGATPTEQERKKQEIRKQIRLLSTLFIIVCIIPLFIYMSFLFNIFETATAGEKDGLQQAVALISTNGSTGTAFLVSPTKLITARHVVENTAIGTRVNLTFEKAPIPITTTATLEWRDETKYTPTSGITYFLTDVAVLRLDEPDKLANILPLMLGDSNSSSIGQQVYLIGYPAVDNQADFSFTEGVISNDKVNDADLFKLDAAANPGNSGGPCILKDDNSVIGILVGEKSRVAEGENIANKINNIKQLIEKAGIDIAQ